MEKPSDEKESYHRDCFYPSVVSNESGKKGLKDGAEKGCNATSFTLVYEC